MTALQPTCVRVIGAAGQIGQLGAFVRATDNGRLFWTAEVNQTWRDATLRGWSLNYALVMTAIEDYGITEFYIQPYERIGAAGTHARRRYLPPLSATAATLTAHAVPAGVGWWGQNITLRDADWTRIRAIPRYTRVPAFAMIDLRFRRVPASASGLTVLTPDAASQEGFDLDLPEPDRPPSRIFG